MRTEGWVPVTNSPSIFHLSTICEKGLEKVTWFGAADVYGSNTVLDHKTLPTPAFHTQPGRTSSKTGLGNEERET